MAKFFAFTDRAIPVQFFEDDPICVTLVASDETDAKILESEKMILEGNQQTALEIRKDKYRGAVDNLVGHDVAERILARSDNADGYAILFLHDDVAVLIPQGQLDVRIELFLLDFLLKGRGRDDFNAFFAALHMAVKLLLPLRVASGFCIWMSMVLLKLYL